MPKTKISTAPILTVVPCANLTKPTSAKTSPATPLHGPIHILLHRTDEVSIANSYQSLANGGSARTLKIYLAVATPVATAATAAATPPPASDTKDPAATAKIAAAATPPSLFRFVSAGTVGELVSGVGTPAVPGVDATCGRFHDMSIVR